MAFQKACVLYDFDGQSNEELTVRVGETVEVIDQNVGDGWWMTRNGGRREGLVPSTYLELQSLPEPAFPPPPPPLPLMQQHQKQVAVASATYMNTQIADEYDDASFSVPSSLMQSGKGVSMRNAVPISEDWNEEDWDDSDDEKSSSSYQPNGTTHRATNRDESVAERPTGARTMSTLSTASSAGEIRGGDYKARAVRGFPKISGLKDFLCNDAPKRVSEADVINIIESECGCIWEAASNKFTCAITQPKKETKMKGLKSFIAYQITPSFSGIQVSRRYKHFDWLYKQLLEKFPCICVPPLPDKQITGRYEEDFILSRMRQLQLWINRVVRHPVLGHSQVFNHFLACTDEKRWKDGKRRAEKDDLRGGQFFLCIRPPMRPVEWNRVDQHTDALDNFVSEMDIAVKIVQENLINNSKKQQNQIRKEYCRVGEGFKSLGQAFEQDPDRDNASLNLTQAINRMGTTYNDIGALFAKQHERDIDPLLERLQEYQGILSCFPHLIQMQRGGIQTVRECQRNLDDARISRDEFSSTVQRAAVISCAQTAETNYFQRERIRDFNSMMRSYLVSQIEFYREITNQLEGSLSSFSNKSY